MKMQNVGQGTTGDNQKLDQVSAQEVGKSSTPESSNSSPTKSETDTFSGLQPRYMTDSSVEDEDDVSEVESFVIEQVNEFEEAEARLTSSKFLLNQEEGEQSVDPETQARLEALLEAAGIGKLATGDGKQLADPEVLRRLTSSVSCALDEAAAALTRMRTENSRPLPERSLVEACSDGDVGTVKKLLTEGRSVHETTEEGESLLSLACSAGYYELAQVLLAMHANVEDRGIKGDCTPLMEAASSGFAEIVQLLIHNGADVNAQSTSGNTPLMYACAGGHNDVVRILLDAGANVEDHNENGHTPLMEAASAGHVMVASTLLERGAGINTHSNEFKESALTLACYKGHLDMVRFLLAAGADQEHKTDEMHTALMEASMDGHVEVARLLLDSGAQVNMPTDSFESPLTLAACGGHVDLALLLIERGANIEEVNDEGYTPLMEAAREGHEEMVSLLLSKGANINAQTEETQETALTLACCGGFLEVADFLIQKGAEIELGASTPLMEAAQEGHLDLVRYLVEHEANVNAQTQTGDTALTYSCENGHTEVAKLLLQYGADLEHESEGGRTPLMKACRAGHLCTVKFLLSRNANVNKQTANNDHTPLSLAAAGGHITVVELLLAHQADPFHKLKDNSTMLIEAAKGGHTNVVQLLLDYPHSIMMSGGGGAGSGPGGAVAPPGPEAGTPVSPTTVSPPKAFTLDSLSVLPPPPVPPARLDSDLYLQPKPTPPPPPPPAHSRVSSSCGEQQQASGMPAQQVQPKGQSQSSQGQPSAPKSLLKKNRLSLVLEAINPDSNQHQKQERDSGGGGVSGSVSSVECCREDALDKGGTQPRHHLIIDPQYFHRQTQIVQELQRVEEELKKDGIQREAPLSPTTSVYDFLSPPTSPHSALNQDVSGNMVDLLCESITCEGDMVYCPGGEGSLVAAPPPAQLPDPGLPAQPPSNLISGTITLPSEVVQSTAISDRPKAKPFWKKEGKNARKQAASFQSVLHHQTMALSDQHIQALQQQHQLQSQQQLVEGVPDDGSVDGKNSVFSSHIIARVQQQLDFAVAAVGNPPNLTPSTHITEPPPPALQLGFGGSEVSGRCLGEGSAEVDGEGHTPVKITKSLAKQLDPRFSLENADKFDWGNIDEIASRVTNEDINIHLGMLKHAMRKAAASRLPGPGSLFTEGLSPGEQAPPLPSQPLQEQPSPLHMYPANKVQQVFIDGYQAGLAEAMIENKAAVAAAAAAAAVGGLRNLTRPSLVAPPPPPPLGTSQPPGPQPTSQPQHTLLSKCPPPPPCDCHGTGKQDGKEQVQAYTQTSPALLPPPLEGTKRPDQPPAKGKKARYQQQKGSLPHHHSYGGGECVGAAGGTATTAAAPFSCMDVDSATDSNNDTALTLACAGGHEELVELLLSRGANIEHRDKKGFTPLILAATAGHEKVVEILLNHSADMEAQSERTKDTPLSLACSGGRYEVVELLLQRGANKEHRNVSDYTPLSLAASGGYVNIIKLLLSHGAEINSRTGSKLGISPLMLAAMNGHTAAVKLLLDMGSDINAQIETNRNTALTLACFQGRHEVVSLLLDRKATVEHRAKTGLTPLMEAASGGYVEVGRVLLDKGADVNAPPVPSSRDTALTIAADKGHVRFVELLLARNAQVEVKNKKGNSPLWLAANGGHLSVVELLYNMGADIDSQDNRKVSCLMAAFRKGHVKVVKWMVNHVNQFPSDQEMTRYISTVSDKELLDKCQECVKIIRVAKDQQAAKANKNATILLEELYMEKTREESRRAAAARRRERKKKKKLEKRKLLEEIHREENEGAEDQEEEPDTPVLPASEIKSSGVSEDRQVGVSLRVEPEEGDSGIDANSQGSCSSTEQVKLSVAEAKKKDRKKKKSGTTSPLGSSPPSPAPTTSPSSTNEKRPVSIMTKTALKTVVESKVEKSLESKPRTKGTASSSSSSTSVSSSSSVKQPAPLPPLTSPPALMFETRHPADRDDFESTGSDLPHTKKKNNYVMYCEEMVSNKTANSTSPKQAGKRDEGWKEVVRKYLNNTYRSKKVSVPLNAISRVIGRGGSNINAIRTATGAHIEVEKQSKGQGERTITLKGSTEATKQAHSLITALIKDPDVDILQLLPKSTKSAAQVSWEKSVNTAKMKPGNIKPGTTTQPTSTPSSKTTSGVKRVGGPKDGLATLPMTTSTKTIMSYMGAIMTTSKLGNRGSQTFAAKLSESTPASIASLMSVSQAVTLSPLVSTPSRTEIVSQPVPVMTTVASPTRPERPATPPVVPVAPSPPAPPAAPSPAVSPQPLLPPTTTATTTRHRTPTPPTSSPSPPQPPPTTLSEYSLFNDNSVKVSTQMWGPRELGVNKAGAPGDKGMNFASVAATGSQPGQPTKYLDPPSHPQVDASKAPGYRSSVVKVPGPVGGTVGPVGPVGPVEVRPVGPPAPVSVATSSPAPGYFPPHQEQQVVNHVSAQFSRPVYQEPTPVDIIQQTFQPQPPQQVSMSRLNPRAPDFASSFKQQMFNNFQGGGAPPGGALVGTVQVPYPTKFPRPPAANGRWHHLPHPPVYHTQMELMACANHQENGGEDRKPRPIGTERSAWKNNNNQLYQAAVAAAAAAQVQELEMGGGGGGGSWAGLSGLEAKVGWAQPPPPPIERPQHQLYRQPPLQFSRIPPQPHIPDDISSHIIDTYQYLNTTKIQLKDPLLLINGGLEGGLGQFGSGGGGAGGLLASGGHSVPVVPAHYSEPSLQEQLAAPCWASTSVAVAAAAAAAGVAPQPPPPDQSRGTMPLHDLTSSAPADKHGWTAKWNH